MVRKGQEQQLDSCSELMYKVIWNKMFHSEISLFDRRLKIFAGFCLENELCNEGKKERKKCNCK